MILPEEIAGCAVHTDLGALGADGPTAVTLGRFDGVHQGHRALLRATVAAARETSETRAVALTLWPPPEWLLRPDDPRALLTTLEDRLALMATTGVDAIVVLTIRPRVRPTKPACVPDPAAGRHRHARPGNRAQRPDWQGRRRHCPSPARARPRAGVPLPGDRVAWACHDQSKLGDPRRPGTRGRRGRKRGIGPNLQSPGNRGARRGRGPEAGLPHGESLVCRLVARAGRRRVCRSERGRRLQTAADRHQHRNPPHLWRAPASRRGPSGGRGARSL